MQRHCVGDAAGDVLRHFEGQEQVWTVRVRAGAEYAGAHGLSSGKTLFLHPHDGDSTAFDHEHHEAIEFRVRRRVGATAHPGSQSGWMLSADAMALEADLGLPPAALAQTRCGGTQWESARPASRDVPVFRSLGGRGHFDSGGEEDGFSGDDARTFARRRRRLLGDFDRGLNLHHVS